MKYRIRYDDTEINLNVKIKANKGMINIKW